MSITYQLQLKYHINQKKILQNQKQYNVVVKGRRFGATDLCAKIAIKSALQGISPILWVDTIQANIDKYYQRYFLPILNMLPQGIHEYKTQKKELKLGSGIIDFRSAERPENIEGFGYQLVILNESGIILWNSLLWEQTIKPMLFDFQGKVFFVGTPKGRNKFFALANKAQSGEKDWQYFHFTTYDNPLLNRETIDNLAKDMPEDVKQQEIYGNFLENMAGIFRNIDSIAVLKDENQPPRKQETYFAGLDLGRKVDWTVLCILNQYGDMVYMHRMKDIDWTVQEKMLIETIRRYNNAIVYLDSTGVGDPIYDVFVRAGLRVEPYQFTNESKKRLVENLMLAVEKQEIRIFQNEVLQNEMMNFTYEITNTGRVRYTAPEGLHDDCVIALSLAVMSWQAYTRRIHISDEVIFVPRTTGNPLEFEDIGV